jgi:chromosome partitioning protein
MPIIAIANQKGGVGKTTISFNLANGLARCGHSVLVIDNDPQGNLTGAFLQDPTTLKANILDFYEDRYNTIPQNINSNLALIGANIQLSKVADGDFEIIYKLKEGLETLTQQYDFVLIDCLPSFGYLNMAALNAAHYVLIPTKPAPFALMGLKDFFSTVEKAKKRLNDKLQVLGIILNLVEGRKTTIAEELENTLRETYGNLVFETIISKGTKLEESPSFNQSIMDYDPKSKQTLQFNDFLKEFLKRVQL